MMTALRRSATAVLTATTILLLAGCSKGEAEMGSTIDNNKTVAVASDATPDEVKDQLSWVLDSAQNTLGGEWQNGDTFLPVQCAVEGGGEGVYFDGHRTRTDDSSDPAADAEAIADAWRSAGLTVETGGYADDHKLVSAVDASGLNLTFTAQGNRLSILAESACAAADYSEVRKDFGQRLKDLKG